MKFPIRLASMCAVLSVTLPAMAFDLVHSEGAISLPSVASNIVTFDLAVLDSLNTLDIAVAGVPKSSYQGSLAKFSDSPVVGTLFEPDYPALVKLKPDLIFAGGRSQKEIPKLKEIAPTAMLKSDPSAFLDSFRQGNLALADAFQKKDQAQEAINVIDENVKALHAANQGKTAAFLFVVRDNVIAHVPGDRFGYAYELAGLTSVLPAKDPKAPAAARPEPGSPEAKAAEAARAEAMAAIAKAEPDWLIVLDRGAINGAEKTAASTLEKHPLLSQTQAFKEGRVVYVDPNGWYIIGGGLNNLKEITDDLLTAMK
ncbi:ABC transporter substrate-binding protein [Paenalcaligenes niemegkensis]|uniref:ABC transporter substrate-binding protein n=1 Tax=Paenalcaligenes niemegkensis TaxID=2895469 RepID=UPI001EE8CE1A|nr:ABC transporter substrate-binding protein [Paenalcaligenes niemegkensis]MCQ9617462.1 ABC transporter substrate-binding protein [Paenalcaligenes niemegkensis]